VMVTGGHQDKTLTCSTTCTLTGNPTYIWYKNGHKVKEDTSTLHSDYFSDAESYSLPGYKGHIEYLGDKKSDCTLRITDLRLSDSAGYRFRFITSGEKFYGSPVSLTVTASINAASGCMRENVTLTCRTKCTLDPITVYSWYKNGQPIPNSNTYSPVYILFSVSSEDTGRYSCAVEGHEDLPSAEETLIVRFVFFIDIILLFLNVIILIYLVKCADVLYLLNLMSSESQDNIYYNQDVNVFLMVLY
uniref:Ig-like domain-containing protein n=1 Tax=Salmo trutta TaxID=8032 RepID=A0A674AQI1_SALTR